MGKDSKNPFSSEEIVYTHGSLLKVLMSLLCLATFLKFGNISRLWLFINNARGKYKAQSIVLGCA